MTTTTGASANDRTRAASDTARGTKQQTITGGIKELFRKAAKAVTGRADDAPRPKTRRRKKGEDTRDAFPAAARLMAGHHARRQHANAASTFLSETLDWLNLWNHNTAATGSPGSDSNTPSNHLSLHM